MEKSRPPIFHARMAARNRDGAPLSQEIFASEVDIHPITLAKAERYGQFVPGKRVAAKIARITGQSPGQVIDDYQKHQRVPEQLKRRAS